MKKQYMVAALFLALLLLTGCGREAAQPSTSSVENSSAPAPQPEEEPALTLVWTTDFQAIEGPVLGGSGRKALAHTPEAKEWIDLETGEREPLPDNTACLLQQEDLRLLLVDRQTGKLEVREPDGSLWATGVTAQNPEALFRRGGAALLPVGEQLYLFAESRLYLLSEGGPRTIGEDVRFQAAAALPDSLLLTGNPRENPDWADHLYTVRGTEVEERTMPELAGTVRQLCPWEQGALAATDSALYALAPEGAEPVINLVEYGISPDGLRQILASGEEVLLLLEDGCLALQKELVPADEAEPVILEAACLQDYPGITGGLLAAFNRQSSRIRVRPTLYGSVEELNLALLTGQMPDLLFPGGNVEAAELCRSRGFLAPAPLPETVTEESYFLSVLDLADRYYFPLFYELHAYSLPEDLAGDCTRLDTMEDLDAMLASVPPEAYDSVYREQIFGWLFAENLQTWVDRASGKAFFDSRSFGELLTWCSRFVPPEDQVRFDVSFPLGDAFIATDEQMAGLEHKVLLPAPFSPWNGPGVNGTSYAAVTVRGAQKPETAEVLAYLLGEEAQTCGASFGLNPLKRSAAAAPVTGSWGYVPEEYREQRMALIDQADHYLMDAGPIRQIVLEEAEYYFAGARSLEQTQTLIQDRVNLYLMEQKTS